MGATEKLWPITIYSTLLCHCPLCPQFPWPGAFFVVFFFWMATNHLCEMKACSLSKKNNISEDKDLTRWSVSFKANLSLNRYVILNFSSLDKNKTKKTFQSPRWSVLQCESFSGDVPDSKSRRRDNNSRLDQSYLSFWGNNGQPVKEGSEHNDVNYDSTCLKAERYI